MMRAVARLLAGWSWGCREGEDSYPQTGSFLRALGMLTTSEGLSKPGGLPCFEQVEVL